MAFILVHHKKRQVILTKSSQKLFLNRVCVKFHFSHSKYKQKLKFFAHATKIFVLDTPSILTWTCAVKNSFILPFDFFFLKESINMGIFSFYLSPHGRMQIDVSYYNAFKLRSNFGVILSWHDSPGFVKFSYISYNSCDYFKILVDK